MMLAQSQRIVKIRSLLLSFMLKPERSQEFVNGKNGEEAIIK